MFKTLQSRLSLALPVALVGAAANAAVPASAEAVFTGAATDFGTVLGYGYTAMAVILGGFIVMKLIKKVATKSTS